MPPKSELQAKQCCLFFCFFVLIIMKYDSFFFKNHLQLLHTLPTGINLKMHQPSDPSLQIHAVMPETGFHKTLLQSRVWRHQYFRLRNEHNVKNAVNMFIWSIDSHGRQSYTTHKTMWKYSKVDMFPSQDSLPITYCLGFDWLIKQTRHIFE